MWTCGLGNRVQYIFTHVMTFQDYHFDGVIMEAHHIPAVRVSSLRLIVLQCSDLKQDLQIFIKNA